MPIQDDGHAATFTSAVSEWLGRQRFSLTVVHSQVAHWAKACELQLLPAAQREGRSSLTFVVNRRQGRPPGPLQSADGEQPVVTHRLADLLSSIGVDRVELDVRLESNQITDVLAVLWILRRKLARIAEGQDRPARPGRLADLLSPEGLSVACTNTRLLRRDRTLLVRYSYCQTVLSRAIRRFKQRNRDFRDHRAFYRAAGRYASAVVLVGVIPLVMVALSAPLWSISIVAGLIVGVVGLAVYLFFLSVGSVEYDNEVQAQQLETAYTELKAYSDSTQADLRRASQIQQNLLPPSKAWPFQDRIDVASHFKPEREVGGDYYDLRALDNHCLAVFFCDVSGHGMAAAFVTGLLKAFFEITADPVNSVTDYLSELNRRLCQLTPDDSFAAVIYGVLDVRTGEFSYCNAGHGPPGLWVHRNGQPRCQWLDGASSPLVGVMPHFQYEQASIQLQPGDLIAFVTDGVTEARNRRDEMFGSQRLLEVAAGTPWRDASQLCTRLNQEMVDFTEDLPQHDDQATLVIGYRPSAAEKNAGPPV